MKVRTLKKVEERNFTQQQKLFKFHSTVGDNIDMIAGAHHFCRLLLYNRIFS